MSRPGMDRRYGSMLYYTSYSIQKCFGQVCVAREAVQPLGLRLEVE